MKNLISYRTEKTIHNGNTTVVIGKTHYTTSVLSKLGERMGDIFDDFCSLPHKAYLDNHNRAVGISKPDGEDEYDEMTGFIVAQSKAESKSLKAEVREIERVIGKLQSFINDLNELKGKAESRISEVDACYSKTLNSKIETKAHLLD